ncbi:MAG: hypothetical protein UX04_C0008G0008 [Microgenomates group bacterium GW2011_GWF2_45_18]|nr:MAG: hypothetical protein UW18_C0008G0012 [Microgenomates group bacterium GW2011_GWF1_44_10]KKU01396.1 MAG: hypothetical protein UX04_C0008G0008 [Microgenomates group bacterium GW2011_GWF2_45_18]HAX01944.1 hypothetical protein [Candidatus Paceibacterota bacterium]
MTHLKHATLFGLCCASMTFFGKIAYDHFTARAEMNSNSYVIQYGNINMSSGTQTKDGSYTVTQTSGQTAPGEFNSTGFTVKSGFQYIYSIGTFGFTLSSTALDLGELSPNTFSSTPSTVITVSAKGAGGYTVFVGENNPLTFGVQTIPDTTCNSGSCSETTVGLWDDATKYGFGYSLSGTNIASGFTTTEYFKQFADFSGNEPPQVIMSSADVADSEQATLLVKAAVDGTQQAGSYENMLYFIALPVY